ncbi:MAG: hypothetical protein ACPGVB_14310 [Chitinophagales bacterium]
MFQQALNYNALFAFVLFTLFSLSIQAQDHTYKIVSNPFDTKVLIAQEEDGNWTLVKEESTLQKAIEEEYYDGTKITQVELTEQNGIFYLSAEGTVSNGSEKILRLSLEKNTDPPTELYLTTHSKLESCYAVRCDVQDFAEGTCICNEPVEFGMSSYQAQDGFFLTKKGLGGLITAKRLKQSAQKLPLSRSLIPIQTVLGHIDGLVLTFNQERLHKAIQEELVTPTQITKSFIVAGNEGKHYLLAKGTEGTYVNYARMKLSLNGKGELYITPSSTLEICRTNCGDVGSFTMGGECECLTTNNEAKDFRFTSKSNFINTSAGIGSLFKEQK